MVKEFTAKEWELRQNSKKLKFNLVLIIDGCSASWITGDNKYMINNVLRINFRISPSMTSYEILQQSEKAFLIEQLF